jgi:hypothetical protein
MSASGSAASFAALSIATPRKPRREQISRRTRAEFSPIPAVKTSASRPPSATAIAATAAETRYAKTSRLPRANARLPGDELLEDAQGVARFERIEPERVLALPSSGGNWVWSFVLEEEGGGARLISRNRFRLPRLRDKIGMIPMQPGSLIMERKMLIGIKQRVEGSAEAGQGSRTDGHRVDDM